MRYTSLVAAAAAVTPLAVSATGKLGYALGTRLIGKLALQFSNVIHADLRIRWVVQEPVRLCGRFGRAEGHFDNRQDLRKC